MCKIDKVGFRCANFKIFACIDVDALRREMNLKDGEGGCEKVRNEWWDT